MSEKTIIWTGDMAVGFDEHYYHTLEDFEEDLEYLETVPGVIDCYRYEPMRYDASELVEHIFDNLDENYCNKDTDSYPSENLVGEDKEALVNNIQALVDEYLQKFNWYRYVPPDFVMDIRQFTPVEEIRDEQ